MNFRRCSCYAIILYVALIAVAFPAMAQKGKESRRSEPGREFARRRAIEEFSRYGRELTPHERFEHQQRRIRMLQLGFTTENQYKNFERFVEMNRRSRETEHMQLLADPEVGELAKSISCVVCVDSPFSASTLRQVIRRQDGAAEALIGAYQSGPLGIGMREAFGALAAGAPIPEVLRSGTFDTWVRGLGRRADLVEVLWNDAAKLREYDHDMKWNEALHRAARKYRDSKRLSSDDPALEEMRVASLLRRLREAGCL